jgi:hypothetical protein
MTTPHTILGVVTMETTVVVGRDSAAVVGVEIIFPVTHTGFIDCKVW